MWNTYLRERQNRARCRRNRYFQHASMSAEQYQRVGLGDTQHPVRATIILRRNGPRAI